MFKRVIIADDHYVVRIGTAMALEGNDCNVKIEFAESYFDIENLLEQEEFDLIMFDINMPGVTISSIREIKQKCPNIKVMLFSAQTGNTVLQYIKQGADGYLNKLSGDKQIVDAVNTLYSDGYYFTSDITVSLLNKSDHLDPEKLLSEREYEVYKLMIRGFGNLEITNTLSLHPSTISTYKRRIFKKLKVESIVGLLKTDKSQLEH